MRKIQAILSRPVVKNMKLEQVLFYVLIYTMAFSAAFQFSQF